MLRRVPDKINHKCDGTRPRCNPCGVANLRCEFIIPKGLTQRQNDRQKISDYQSVLELLRKGSLAESVEVLKRIREADNIEERVKLIADSLLLLPAPPSSLDLDHVTDVPQKHPHFVIPRRQNLQLTSPLEFRLVQVLSTC